MKYHESAMLCLNEIRSKLKRVKKHRIATKKSYAGKMHNNHRSSGEIPRTQAGYHDRNPRLGGGCSTDSNAASHTCLQTWIITIVPFHMRRRNIRLIAEVWLHRNIGYEPAADGVLCYRPVCQLSKSGSACWRASIKYVHISNQAGNEHRTNQPTWCRDSINSYVYLQSVQPVGCSMFLAGRVPFSPRRVSSDL